MENKKSSVIRFILKLILGGYIIFVGIVLQYEMFQERPSDMALKSAIAVIYIVVGAVYLFFAIRQFVVRALQVKKIKEQIERETEEKTQWKHRQEQKRKMLRTAPMPSESEIIRGTVKLKTKKQETEEQKLEKTVEASDGPDDTEELDQFGKSDIGQSAVHLDEEADKPVNEDDETDFEEV